MSGIGKRMSRCSLLGPTVIKATGFTLIELLIVIALVIVLAGLAVPQMKGTIARFQFETAAQQIRSHLQYLQTRSLAEQRIFQLAVDEEKHIYWIGETTEDSFKEYKLPSNVEIKSDKAEIHFYPDGSMDKAHITLASQTQDNATLITQGAFGGIELLFP